MKIRKLQVAIVAASLAFVSAANAQIYLTGTMGANDLYGGGSAGSGSLTLASTMVITGGGTGDYAPGAGIIPMQSDLTCYTGTISGIGTSPTTENIDGYLTFSSPDANFSSSGTTPNNRFVFNLATLTQTAYYGDDLADFVGTGTVVDTTGYYADTLAIMTIGFSGAGSYSFTFASTAPVPEPTTLAMLAGGCLVLIFKLRIQRKSREA